MKRVVQCSVVMVSSPFRRRDPRLGTCSVATAHSDSNRPGGPVGAIDLDAGSTRWSWSWRACWRWTSLEGITRARHG